MKRVILILPLLAVVVFLNGQIANNWTLGYHAGLNFATTPPTFFLDSISASNCLSSPLDTVGAFAANSISDCNGNLLFYTNGEVVWNKQHQRMPNYCLKDTNGNGGLKTKILKLINSDTLYYIFYSNSPFGLRYAIININADNGKGDIISGHNFINNNLVNSYLLPPELIRHANDTDYWLVCKPNANEIYSYLITSQGINLTPVISGASGFLSDRWPIKASLTGKYLFYSDQKANTNGTSNNSYVCNFNRSTGMVSNKKTLYSYTNFPSSNDFAFYDAEFSPNDSFVYIILDELDLTITSRWRVIQLKRFIGIPGNSQVQLYDIHNVIGGIQLAPDGKIYLSNLGTTILSCITRPDETGFASNYIYSYMDLAPFRLRGGFPSVYFPLKRLKFNATAYTITTCLTDSVRLFAQGDTTFLNYRWYFYNSNNTLTDSSDAKNPVLWLNPGAYKVKLRAKNPECNSYTWWTDDIYVSYKPKLIVVIDSVKVSCVKQRVHLHYSTQFADSARINWGDGTYSSWQSSINASLNHDYFDTSHVYSITVTAINNNCNTSFVINDTVTLQPKPGAKFFSNNNTKTFPITGCTPLNINLADSSKNADSVWFIIKNTSGIHSQFSTLNSQFTDTGWFDIAQYTTTKDGCMDSFIVSNAVYVSAKPTAQVLKDSIYQTCLQNNLRLRIDASYNDSTYITWGDGNTDQLAGMRNGSRTDTITHYYAIEGNYTIIVLSKNDYCNALSFLTHIVRPPLQITVSNDTTICKGTFTNLWAIGTGADSVFTYILRTPSGTLQNSSGLFLVPPDSTTTYTIGAINACSVDTLWKQITITLMPPLALQLNTTDTTVCKGSTLTINATGSGGNGNYNYVLKKNNIAQQNNATGIFNITANSNEIYTIVLSDNCTTINDSAICKINIFTPLQFTQILPDVYLCEGETTTLKANTNNGSGAVSYLWTDAGGNILSTLDTLYFIPNTSTQIILKATDACISIYDTVWLYHFATTGSTQLLTDVSSGCAPLIVNFETPTLSYSNAEAYEASWNFGDGNISTQSFTNTLSTLKSKHTYTNAGIYLVNVKLKFKNRASECYTLTTTVEALTVPQIQLSITPKKITLPKTQCTAVITTANADSVVIDWADGFSDNFNTNLSLITQTHDYADTGHYIVKATAYNKNTCYTETLAGVYHADTFICFIPNAFTPNRDATNETFKPVVSFCKNYTLTIYDRWGEVVYETNYIAGKTPQPSWTGEGNAAGTYIYKFTAKDLDNKSYSFKGTVMLIR